jgi:hypothetical protein
VVTDDVRAHRDLRVWGYVLTLAFAARATNALEDRFRDGRIGPWLISGCHWTATSHGWSVASTASMMPSADSCDDLKVRAQILDRLVVEARDRDRGPDELVQPARASLTVTSWLGW